MPQIYAAVTAQNYGLSTDMDDTVSLIPYLRSYGDDQPCPYITYYITHDY